MSSMVPFRAYARFFIVLLILNICLGRFNDTINRRLSACDSNAAANSGYSDYFADIQKIYGQHSTIRKGYESTCLPLHNKCGWPQQMRSTSPVSGAPSYNDLPLFVLGFQKD